MQCKSDCVFAILNQKTYTKFIKNANDYAKEEAVDFLKNEPMFQVWSKTNIIKLFDSITLKKLHKEKVVLTEGQNLKHFYFIKKGEF